MGKREASGNRVDAIIEAALQLFLERGYDNTPLSAVAERLGLTKAGVYHHFATKEDLLFMAHRRTMEPGSCCRCSPRRKPSRTRKSGFEVSIFEHARTLALEPTTGLLIRAERAGWCRNISPRSKSLRRRGLKVLRNSVAELQARGRCRTDVNPTHAAFAAIGMTNWIPFWFDPKWPDSADEVKRARCKAALVYGRALLHRTADQPGSYRSPTDSARPRTRIA